jgi:hypothetical protein
VVSKRKRVYMLNVKCSAFFEWGRLFKNVGISGGHLRLKIEYHSKNPKFMIDSSPASSYFNISIFLNYGFPGMNDTYIYSLFIVGRTMASTSDVPGERERNISNEAGSAGANHGASVSKLVGCNLQPRHIPYSRSSCQGFGYFCQSRGVAWFCFALNP